MRLLGYFWNLLLYNAHEQGLPQQHVLAPAHPSTFTASTTWQILGPFQIGTRGTQAAWGADPLEYYGGFRSLEYDPGARFKSSLSANGTAGWILLNASNAEYSPYGAEFFLEVAFPQVDWQLLQSVYGWAALQHQAWARTEITIAEDTVQTLVLYTDHVLEYWIDGKPYFGGDFYAYRKTAHVLHLQPGRHRFDLRLVRDVRAMGGTGDPTIQVTVRLEAVSAGVLQPVENGFLMSDVIDGQLASPLGSVALRNNGLEPVEVHSVHAVGHEYHAAIAGNRSVIIAPGQTRPIPFHLALRQSSIESMQLGVAYRVAGSESPVSIVNVARTITSHSIYEPHKITFMHPGGIVSYAILRPPSKNASRNACRSSTAPVLLQLHGAGLEADSNMVAHALDPVPDICAWVLFPTGVTPWSGDDWHTWGFADVEAAVSAIPSWIEANGWQGVGVDADRWLVSGHSNGGQGTWYALTHRPDKIIAAAPVSGYLSIQNYVPYQMWHTTDPRRRSILEASMNSYRHEALVENCKGIPILQQHGSIDDNVPAYHSRLMSELLFEANWTSIYSELPGKGHWFDGVMTTDALRGFYERSLSTTAKSTSNISEFGIVVGNPGDMGPKQGIHVLQLEAPGQYGRIDVAFDPDACSYTVSTSNILAFQVDTTRCLPKSVFVDNVEFSPKRDRGQDGSFEFWKTAEGLWKLLPLTATSSTSIAYRRGRQLGSLDALLRTKGRFTIRYHSTICFDVALQISRNLFQYFSADATLVNPSMSVEPDSGNLITVAIGSSLPEPPCSAFPIRVTSARELSIRDSNGRVKRYSAEDGLSALFLRPMEDERLEVVVWGVNEESLTLAARLMPMMTGVGQPDFIVLGKRARWKGVDGATAMGFFDHMWNVTQTSFFT